MRRVAVLSLLLLSAVVVQAQNNAIQWRREPAQAVAEAKRVNRPILAYVLASERYRDDQLDREHKRSFRDKRVMRRAARDFVPLRLSRARHRDLLREFGFSEQANMEMSFVTPDGKIIGRISAMGIAQVDSLIQKMDMVFEEYAKRVYADQVKGVLSDSDAKVKDIQQALDLVYQMRMKFAISDLITLLGREDLSPALHNSICRTLAAFSTRAAVDKLLELAKAGDKVAAKELGNCTPVAAEFMLPTLKLDEEPFDYDVYEIITRICRIPKAKPERFFENAPTYMKKEELERVDQAVRAAAAAWKAANG
jgi:hypothetical protein